MLKAIPSHQWDFTTAAHLLNRAGFGGTPDDVEHLVKLGPEQAVAHLVDYEQIPDSTLNPDWAKPDPERLEYQKKIREADEEARRKLVREQQQKERQQIVELKHWWLQRMATGPRPLQEKLTLFWHGHFATSVEKVREPYFMWRQNDLFRQKGNGGWLDLLTATALDPAMLIWLDQAQSRREHPNENFAREVMELFTLGEGHYTEKDVTEAARAMTGWSFDRQDEQFIDRPRIHDNGAKTVLGRTGNLDGYDVLEVIVEQPQAAKFITAKLWKFFAGQEPTPEVAEALAASFRDSGNHFKPLLRTIFLSEEFYASDIIRNQVKSPVQWLVGSVRMLQRDLPGPVICFGLTKNLGQDLFAPPNVKGWDGGMSWITTNNLLARYNEAAILVQGDTDLLRNAFANLGLKPAANNMIQNRMQNVRLKTVNVEKLLSPEEREDKTKLVAALERRLLQAKLSPRQEDALHDYLGSQPTLNDTVVQEAIRLMMSTPDFQLT